VSMLGSSNKISSLQISVFGHFSAIDELVYLFESSRSGEA